MKGIDVSHHQGVIDWAAVKAGGVEFAMIRAGWTWYDGGITLDKRLEENITGAQAAGLEVGVYVYSYDLTAQAAKKGAQALVAALTPYRLTMPVAFDLEPDPDRVRTMGRELNPAEAQAIASAALEELEGAGYYVTLYSCMSWFESHLSGLERYDRWIAKWGGERPGLSHGMWQYDVVGQWGTQGKEFQTYGAVPGVSANCDVDVAYRDYPAIIRGAGLNGWGTAPEEPEPPLEDEGEQLRAQVAELTAKLTAAQADALEQRARADMLEAKIQLGRARAEEAVSALA